MSVAAEIRRRIQSRGPLTFAEFMEAALYWPHGGYYRGGRGDPSPTGPEGDYYTSPLAHPAFGALLAVQVYQFWELLGRPRPFTLVELGAGGGQLARDILAAAAALPRGFPDSLRYLGLDYNPGTGLPEYANFASVAADGIPLRNLQGCILSNELLDAFPVHQVRVEQGRLREVFITLDPAKGVDAPLVEQLGEPSTPALAARLEELGIRLAEGQTAEINLRLDTWAESVVGALENGFVLTIDYGRPAADLYSAQLRLRGTLTTYYRHTQTDAPLRQIGHQDITTQVDFTALVNAGRRAGLEFLGTAAQGRFLQNLGLDDFRRRLNLLANNSGFDAGKPAESARQTPVHPGSAQGGDAAESQPARPLSPREIAANRAGLLALSRPGGLGDFTVLAQGKNLPPPVGKDAQLWGLEPNPAAAQLTASLPLPLLTNRHISLPQGWPQAAEQEFQLNDLWANPFG